ncbi:MAG: serine/threonine protein kinase [Deltaproteobacteria bacterium]|nr:serine/threonine protein kinase [Deltaproteobacteria bacterium]
MARAIRSADGSTARLDRYELVAELAAGGMATVLLARLSGAGGFQRFFAIKRLHPHLAHEQEFVQMFLDEARLAARIHHPNVVPILEVGTSDAGYYLVMEYIEGETLARLIATSAQAGQRIPARVVVRIVLDTLAGLDAAHELRDDDGVMLNLVHRDVSPQNVMVGIDGTARITDFGVASAASRLSTTREGQLKGKLGYMAPEQVRGDAIDRRTDVFAVGVMLWETLAGKRLFRSKTDSNDAEMLNRLLFEPIPTMVETDPTVEPELSAVCERALQREIEQRFESCSQFQDALESAASKSCGIASPREVAAFVETIAGADIAAQKAAVKAWNTQSESRRAADPDLLTVPNSASSPSGISSTSSIRSLQESSSSSVGAGSAFTPPAGAASGRRSGVVMGAMAGMLVLAIPMIVVLLLRQGDRTTGNLQHGASATPVAEPRTPAPASAAQAPSASSSDPDAGRSSDPAEIASSKPPAASGSGGRQTGVNQPGRTVPKGSNPSGKSDDLENNPYR